MEYCEFDLATGVFAFNMEKLVEILLDWNTQLQRGNINPKDWIHGLFTPEQMPEWSSEWNLTPRPHSA